MKTMFVIIAMALMGISAKYSITKYETHTA